MTYPALAKLRPQLPRLLLSALALLLLLAAQQGWVDRIGEHYTEQGLKRALVTFAIARGLNGVISVAQGTEVALEPAGVGVNFTPGQILTPINDLIERFSWVMLAASTSLGLQKLLLTVFAARGFTLVLALALGFALLIAWVPRWRTGHARTLAYRLALALLVVRFAVPVVAIASEGIYQGFLAEQYERSAQGIEQTTARIGQVNQQAQTAAQGQGSKSILDQAKRLYAQTVDALDVNGYLERYRQAAADTSEHAVNLIVIFVLQTVLLPLGFLWITLQLLRKVVNASFRF